MATSDKRARKKENARAAREAREAEARKQKRNKNVIRGVIAAVVVVALAFVISLFNGDDDKKAASDTSSSTTTEAKTSTTVVAIDPAATYTATITTNYGDIVLELDTENAPVASSQFIKLAEDGVYDGSRWHRVVPDFVIQGGAPGGDSTKDYGTAVVGEVPTDNYPVGSLAAAKTELDPAGTFDAQFFIVTGSGGATLPNDYARFGSVTKGLDVAEEIEALAPGGDGEPTKDATIEKIVINVEDSASGGSTTTTAG